MNLEWVSFISNTLVPAGLMLVMFSLGLTLALRDFVLVARSPLLVGTGFGIHIFLLPVLGLVLGAVFQLPPEMALGLFIISICPAGTTSNGLNFVGGGNVALAVVLTALTSMATVLTIPFLLSWAVPWFLERSERPIPSLDAMNVVFQLIRVTVIPVVLGMAVNHFLPALAARLARWLRPTAFIILLLVIGVSVYVSLEMVLENLVRATPAIFALNVCALAIGLGVGRLLGLGPRNSMTLAIETGVQNVTLAIFLTQTVLGSLPLAVTQNIYGVVMLINASLLILWWRPRIAAETS